MKLQHDKGLIEALVKLNDVKSRHPDLRISDEKGGEIDMTDVGMFSGILKAEKATNLILYHIDKWLEQHGFHIYPVKKVKPKFKVGEEAVVTDTTHELYARIGTVVDVIGCAAALKFESLPRKYWFPNEYLSLDMGSRQKGTVSFKEAGEKTSVDALLKFWEKYKEEKPSADGEEDRWKNHPGIIPETISMHKGLVDHKTWLTKQPEFTPWQRCPVCEGRGKLMHQFDIFTDCHCCLGSGVIPMKREGKNVCG